MRARAFFAMVLALATALGAPGALALDVVEAPLPISLPDHQVKIGSRALRLPDGHWNVLARNQSHIVNSGVDRIGVSYGVYAMDQEQGQFRMGVSLWMMLNGAATSRWTTDPCKVQDAPLHRDTFEGSFSQPECLLVIKRRGHLTNTTGDYWGAAREWAEARKVRTSGPIYEIYYGRFATNDMGNVRLFVPQRFFANDEDAVAWARLLPGALKQLFERRIEFAALPRLPERQGQ